MRNTTICAALAICVLFSACATFHAKESWKAKGEALPRGLLVEIGSDSEFRIRGGELEGAVLKGQARRDGESWALTIEKMDYFGNWAEGWTEASFEAEGELSLRPSLDAWTMDVARVPAIEKPVSASIRLNGDYYSGETALGLFSRRWDRIQAVAEVLKLRFPGASFENDGFERGVRAFLFPEIYGYGQAGAPAPKPGHKTKLGESIRWDVEYSASAFPEALREIRNSGTMLRDFEEGRGLWRLAFSWDEFRNQKLSAAVFSVAEK